MALPRNHIKYSVGIHLDTRVAHHEFTLWQPLLGHGGEHPGFLAALVGNFRPLTCQLPALGRPQLGGNNLNDAEGNFTLKRVS